VPPIDDGGGSVDASFEDVAQPPPPPIDSEVPRPDAVPDVVIMPPPTDGATPPLCDVLGPVLSVMRANGEKSEVCAGQLAAHTFTHALCACGDLALGSVRLVTGSFDSLAADKSPVGAGAPVGVRGSYPPAGASIGGSLTVAGTAPPRAPVSGFLDIQGDLRFAGQITFSAAISVKRDAWIASKVWYVTFASVERDLYAPSGGGFFGFTPLNLGGMRHERPVSIEDSCGCADKLDIAAMEKVGAENNHNLANGIDPAALSNVTTAIPPLRIPCGRFRFNSIGGTAPIHLIIAGRTAIFVDGDVAASDSFVLEIAPGTNVEVDWFIGGNLSVGGNAKIGDRTRPSATRIYVAGTQDIQLSSGSIGANIYAPDTNVSLSAGTLSGSVYGKGVSMPSGGNVIYDRAILDQGDKCEQPNTCSKCRYCNGGAACVNNTCDVCTKDEDCCAPLVCDLTLRRCQPLLFR